MSIQEIKSQIISVVKSNLKDLPRDFKIELELPPQSSMGDFCLPCFDLARFLKKPPEKIAAELKEEFLKGSTLKKLKGATLKVVNNGPYLNFFL